jgi:hypothetical protein
VPPPIHKTALDPSVLSRADEFAREFRDAKPFRHLVIDNFLAPAFCQSLIDDFPPFASGNFLNERGEPGPKSTQPDITRLSAPYQRFDALMRHPAFLDLMGKVTGIPGLLYDPDYVGGGTHESLDGADLDLHIDFNYHPKRRWHRRLNLIVFLNPEWQDDWGGCLELHQDAWNPHPAVMKKVAPVVNRAALFETTETSWHGFTRVTLPENRQELSRRSLAIYFYTRERPASETSSSHATVYAPPPLPAHLSAGHTLTEKDVATLEGLIGRRDTQLRFLYERERKFSSLIAGITGSPSFRLGRLLTAPARLLRCRKAG